jgi:N-acetylmuramoyl-L-alanine amidase
MVVEIIKNFVPGYGLDDAYPMDAEWLTIHGTANTAPTADAEMHAKYLNNGAGGRGAYWHLTADDDSAIQHLPFNINGWHGGDGEHGTGNRKSIALEICENSDGDFAKAIDNAAYVAAYVLKTQGIPIERMVPHEKWSGKYCPRKLFNEIGWKVFVHKVQLELDKMNNRVTNTPQPKPEPKNDSFVGKRVESIYAGKDGLDFYSKATFNDRYRVGTLYKGWGFPTILDKIKVEGAYMYKVKNSKGAVYYITASPKYVKVEGLSKDNTPVAKPKPKPQPKPAHGIKAINRIEIVNVNNAAYICDRPDRKTSKVLDSIKKGKLINISGSVKGENNPKGYWEVIYKGKRAYISGQFGRLV